MHNSPLSEAFATTPIWLLCLSFGIGVLFSILYLFMMWQSIKLAQTKGKGVLLGSSLLRLGLFFFVLVLVAGGNPARAILFFAGFIITRSILIFNKKQEFKKGKSSGKL